MLKVTVQVSGRMRNRLLASVFLSPDALISQGRNEKPRFKRDQEKSRTGVPTQNEEMVLISRELMLGISHVGCLL